MTRMYNHISNLLVLSHKMHSKLHHWLKSVTITKKQDVQNNCYCAICGKILTSLKHKYCSKKCQAQARCKRPPQKELEQLWLVQKLTLSDIGRYYRVSHTTIRRWLKFYNMI